MFVSLMNKSSTEPDPEFQLRSNRSRALLPPSPLPPTSSYDLLASNPIYDGKIALLVVTWMVFSVFITLSFITVPC
ncbi:hypothetical protein K439DRAFT_1635981 [Ramaria rubella]|nr:hypothetical protein K439DRAFT_1635981 [Ramaria rubella]